MNRRDQIKDILFRNDKNPSWLKSKLSGKFPSVDVYYLLSEKSVNFDVELYDEIMGIFRKEGFIVTENERCDKFAEQLIQVNGIIAHSTYLLNSNATDFLKDNLLDYREKKKLLELVDKIRREFDQEIGKIEKIIER